MIRPPLSAPAAVCAAAGALAEAAVLGWWAATGSTLVFLALQFAVAALAWLAVTVLRHRGFRRDYEEAIAVNAVLADRNRLAEELHDALGHDLSVIALKAGVLQVRTTGDVQERAAGIRRDVEDAVHRLRRALEAAREPDAPEALDAVIDRLAASGASVTRLGHAPTRLHPVTHRILYRVLREATTNALRHAPGRPIQVVFRTTAETVEVEVRNRVRAAADEEPRSTTTGTGIRALRRRVESAGGRFEAGRKGDEFAVTARMPRRPRPVPAEGLARPRRSPLRQTVRSALLPAGVAAALLTGFYAWATHGGVIEDRVFDRFEAGMPAAEAERLLPAREAPVRLVPAPPHRPEWSCSYYTDGNFPLGLAVFEVCFHDGAVVRVTDLRSRSWV